jgi:hypothetical protein
MLRSLQEIIADHEAGTAAHGHGKPLVPEAAALRAGGATSGRPGTVRVRDSAKRVWSVDVRHDHRGRFLQVRPMTAELEGFRASADGYLPDDWLPITPAEWTAFALFAGGAHGPEDRAEDEELALQVRRLLDRMVRGAQRAGLVLDEDQG